MINDNTKVQHKCSDCGFPARKMSEAVRKKGGMVREPGEALCASCSSSRVLLMRMVDRLPNTLDLIKAMRTKVRA